MRRIFSFILIIVFFCLLIVLSPHSASAQLRDGMCSIGENTAIDTCFNGNPYVDEGTPKVGIDFYNLPVPKTEKGKPFKYFYCLQTSIKDCGEDDWHNMCLPGQGWNGKDCTALPSPQYSSASFFGSLCGDGNKTLKTNDCDKPGNYFHVGKTYRVFLAQGTSEKTVAATPNSNLVANAGFYVRHFYPNILAPTENPKRTDLIISNGTVPDITLTLEGKNPRGVSFPTKPDKYYSAQVLSRDGDYKTTPICIYVKGEGQGTKTITFQKDTRDDGGNVIGTLSPGNYMLLIRTGKNGKKEKTCDPGDFVLWNIPIRIGSDPKTNPGSIGKPIQDPFQKEGRTSLIMTKVEVCTDTDANGYCRSIPTGLGFSIHTQPQLFIRDIFSLVLSIGGIAALVFFIQAGYILMTSAGNKEKVAQAREQITSAIMGIIFIILSITILEFIGINILRLPGFE